MNGWAWKEHRLAGSKLLTELRRHWDPKGDKLNLASGPRPIEGWLNVDKYPPADVLLDLVRDPWPWPDSSWDYVALSAYLEHVSPYEAVALMRNVHRVLRRGGRLYVLVPHAANPYATWGAITHWRGFTEDSFQRWGNGGLEGTSFDNEQRAFPRFKPVACLVQRRLQVTKWFDSWYHPAKYLGDTPNIGRPYHLVAVMEKA